MNGSPTLGKTSGTTDARIPIPRLSNTSGTLRSSHDHFMTTFSIAAPASVVVAEAESTIREAHTNYLHSIALPEISDEEELEWDTLFAQPHVQAGLDRLEEEAMRQIKAGEIEEGGFAVE